MKCSYWHFLAWSTPQSERVWFHCTGGAPHTERHSLKREVKICAMGSLAAIPESGLMPTDPGGKTMPSTVGRLPIGAGSEGLTLGSMKRSSSVVWGGV